MQRLSSQVVLNEPFYCKRFEDQKYLEQFYNSNITAQAEGHPSVCQSISYLHTCSKGNSSVDWLRRKLGDEMFCFDLTRTPCYLLWPLWIALFIKGQVKQPCFNMYGHHRAHKGCIKIYLPYCWLGIPGTPGVFPQYSILQKRYGLTRRTYQNSLLSKYVRTTPVSALYEKVLFPRLAALYRR